jgi:hypothetical protein
MPAIQMFDYILKALGGPDDRSDSGYNCHSPLSEA